MIAISIVLKKVFDPDEEEDWDDSSDNVNSTDDLVDEGDNSLLPARASYLDQVCAEDKLSSDETRVACVDACEPAVDCCNPHESGNSTCFEEYLAGCVTYSQCHALEGANDPAYDDIERVCAMNAIEVDRTECEFACSSVECCYNDTNSCLGSNFQACLDYAPCQNLRRVPGVDDNYIDVAPFTLEGNCRDGESMCDRECREALCCSNPNSSCYRENFIACLSYAWCTGNSETNIKVAPIYSRVIKAPENLENVCLSAYVDTNGPEECQEACADATCCFLDGADGCFGADPLGCLEYRSCSIVQTTGA